MQRRVRFNIWHLLTQQQGWEKWSSCHSEEPSTHCEYSWEQREDSDRGSVVRDCGWWCKILVLDRIVFFLFVFIYLAAWS